VAPPFPAGDPAAIWRVTAGKSFAVRLPGQAQCPEDAVPADCTDLEAWT